LGFRQAEVEETVRVLQDINQGKGDQLYGANPRHEGLNLKDWQGQLAVEDMTLAGHSYGATLAVSPCRMTDHVRDADTKAASGVERGSFKDSSVSQCYHP